MYTRRHYNNSQREGEGNTRTQDDFIIRLKASRYAVLICNIYHLGCILELSGGCRAKRHPWKSHLPGFGHQPIGA